MRSLVSTLITITVSVAYIVDVLRLQLGVTALLIALPYLLANAATVTMLVSSLFSRPVKTDERWSMFFVALVASNAYAVLYFSGIPLLNPDRNQAVSAIGALGTLALVPFYVLAVYTLGSQLTVMPEARKLITRGPYSLSRHPLYVTYIVWFLLQILIAQSLVIVALSGLMVVLLFIRARGEERVLSSAFPDDYAAYRGRVGWLGRWSPRFAEENS
jgi:protein-S-isoprenylcysteine O-methyltransferase Ste14